MATHSSICAWKIPWTEEPGRWATVHGVTKSDITEHGHAHARAHTHTTATTTTAPKLSETNEPRRKERSSETDSCKSSTQKSFNFHAS